MGNGTFKSRNYSSSKRLRTESSPLLTRRQIHSGVIVIAFREVDARIRRFTPIMVHGR